MLTLNLAAVQGNSQYALQRGVDANERSIIRLKKQNKPIRQMPENLEVAKSTIWYIIKRRNTLVGLATPNAWMMTEDD